MTHTTADKPMSVLAAARAAMGLREVEQSLAEVAGRLRAARAVPRPELAGAVQHALTRIQAG